VSAAALAFFAFIGFEDMVNMAEEVREPTRVMPRAILAAVVLTSLLYALVSWAAVRAVPVERLAASERPLALVWEAGSGRGPALLSAIAVAAALNGVLAQIVMASRILYGLGRREGWLAAFARVGRRSGTPVLATAAVGALVIAAALVLPVGRLAGVASTILLGVFAVVNLALIRLKRLRPEAPFRVPGFVPWAGLGGSALALAASVAGR
jgi:amino acid transporter